MTKTSTASGYSGAISSKGVIAPGIDRDLAQKLEEGIKLLRENEIARKLVFSAAYSPRGVITLYFHGHPKHPKILKRAKESITTAETCVELGLLKRRGLNFSIFDAHWDYALPEYLDGGKMRTFLGKL